MAQFGPLVSKVRPVILMTHAIVGMLVSITALAQAGPGGQAYATVAMSNTQNLASGALITPTFLPVQVYNSGGLGRAAAVADLNGDGKADVVTANNTTDNIGVLLGDGDGTLRPVLTYASGGKAPTSIAVADLNGDGRPDLVVGICLSGSPMCGGGETGGVAVLLGNGDGTFQTPTVYASGGWGTDSVVVADVNGDNKPDVLVTNFYEPGKGTGSVGVLIGIGDGTFQPILTYGLNPRRNIAWVAVGDINSDNAVDLVVAKSGAPSGIGVLLGNGDGTFQPDVAYDSGGMSTRATVEDVNGDGKLDLEVGNYDDSVGVMLGNGDGTFQAARIYGSGGHNVWSLAVGDLNRDGKPDLVVANCGPTGKNCNQGQDHSILGVLLGNGDGSFQSVISYDAGVPSVASVLITDMNLDGEPDLLGTCVNLNCGGGAVGVLLNNTRSCTTPPTIRISATPRFLWPPTGKMVPVTISGTITDDCAVKGAAYGVTDEYSEFQPAGPVTVGPDGRYSFTVLLQASRFGSDLNGRSYKVTVRASNNAGKTGSKVTTVGVPHDLGH